MTPRWPPSTGPTGNKTTRGNEFAGDELTLTSTFEGAPPDAGPAEQTMTLTRAE
jgi:hypothetical protein